MHPMIGTDMWPVRNLLIVGGILAGIASAYADIGPDPDEGILVRGRVIDAVTYADGDKAIYVPIRELGKELGVEVGWNQATKSVTFDGTDVSSKLFRKLFDGTNMVDAARVPIQKFNRELAESGDETSVVFWNAETSIAAVPGEKWVEVSLEDQKLMAFQGNRLVLETNISSGKSGHRTPTGEYTAGPEKTRDRVSRKYDDAPMPYAVQVEGDIFIHGSPSVPRYPASHGCIRMPVRGSNNAAKYFFNWISLGSSIRIGREWSSRVTDLTAKASAGTQQIARVSGR